jgi:hypothetical protein
MAPQDEQHSGQSLTTQDHSVIRRWAEERDGTPATVPGTEHGEHLGVLEIDFPGYSGEKLKHVSWEEWFDTFDKRGLEFVYQEHLKSGSTSNFFKVRQQEGQGGA